MALNRFKERGSAPFYVCDTNYFLPTFFLFFIFLLNILTSQLYDSKRFMQVVLLTTTCFTIRFIPKISKKNSILLYILVSSGILSVFYSEHLFTSLHYFLHSILLINLIFLGINLSKNLPIIFLSIASFNIVIICCSLLNYSFYIFDKNIPTADDIIFGFNNIRFFNQIQVISIPIFIYYLNDIKLKRIATIFLIFNLTLLLITGARGAIIATLATIFIGYILKIYNVTTLKKITFLIILAVTLFIFNSLYFSFNTSFTYVLRTTSSGRVQIWHDLITNLQLKNLLIGNGPGSYYNEHFRVSHPHNSILQVIYDWGAVATALFLYLLYKLINSSIKRLNKKGGGYYQSCFLCVVGALSYSLFSGIVVMPIPQTFLFLFIGVLIYYNNSGEIILKRKKIKYHIALIPVLILYLVLTFISYDCKNDRFLGPNFWSHGQISHANCKLTYFEDQ
ncbi:O-antigen ligase family protein [Pseudoalteromonas sp. 19-MNA-CIBAN-0066]|uniref:O-antigen ligase family protein n=2 Tax=unclassified Pseudoalteromonas TaxID=194690 RepID=UPI0033173322